MAGEPQTTPECVCAVVLFLADGTAATQVLHRGDLDGCKAVAEMMPAVAYSGAQPVKEARMVVREAAWWDDLIEGLSHG